MPVVRRRTAWLLVLALLALGLGFALYARLRPSPFDEAKHQIDPGAGGADPPPARRPEQR